MRGEHCTMPLSDASEIFQMAKVTHEVYDARPNDCDLLLSGLATHAELLGRLPHLVTADAAFFSQHNEAGARSQDVRRVAIPNRSTKSSERKKLEKKRWVGFGVIADNLINIGRTLAPSADG